MHAAVWHQSLPRAHTVLTLPAHLLAGTWVPGGCTTTAAAYCQPLLGTEFFCTYRYLPSTTQCRPAAGICDVPEFCTSTSAACPPDASTPNCPPTCTATGLPACVDASSGVLSCSVALAAASETNFTQCRCPACVPCLLQARGCSRRQCVSRAHHDSASQLQTPSSHAATHICQAAGCAELLLAHVTSQRHARERQAFAHQMYRGATARQLAPRLACQTVWWPHQVMHTAVSMAAAPALAAVQRQQQRRQLQAGTDPVLLMRMQACGLTQQTGTVPQTQAAFARLCPTRFGHAGV